MLFLGDDWAEDHHDVELVDDAGRRLARRRLPEGVDGITRLHALIAEHLPLDEAELDPAADAATVRVGIESSRCRCMPCASPASVLPRSPSAPTRRWSGLPLPVSLPS
jgi:hypothetical protein